MIMHILAFGFIPQIIPPYRAAVITVGLFSFNSPNLETGLCFMFLYGMYAFPRITSLVIGFRSGKRT